MEPKGSVAVVIYQFTLLERELKVEKENVFYCVCNHPRSASVKLTHAHPGVFIYHLTWAVIICCSRARITQLQHC